VRVLIVDDETAARVRLETMLEELDVEVVGLAENGVQALEMSGSLAPDVLLLDIAMPEVDGFDVARALVEPRPLVIFQTAHDEHALRAFEHEALDYVVKPVTLDRLSRAIDRARRHLDIADRPPLPRDLLVRFAAAAGVTAAAKPRLLVRDHGGHRLLALRDIDRFAAARGAVYAHADCGRFLTDYTLTELEERTLGGFVRCSRSDLVNIDRIRRIATHADGSAELALADGTAVRVSRRRAAEVRATIAR
jgi:two-component system LytT family response regulator